MPRERRRSTRTRRLSTRYQGTSLDSPHWTQSFRKRRTSSRLAANPNPIHFYDDLTPSQNSSGHSVLSTSESPAESSAPESEPIARSSTPTSRPIVAKSNSPTSKIPDPPSSSYSASSSPDAEEESPYTDSRSSGYSASSPSPPHKRPPAPQGRSGVQTRAMSHSEDVPKKTVTWDKMSPRELRAQQRAQRTRRGAARSTTIAANRRMRSCRRRSAASTSETHEVTEGAATRRSRGGAAQANPVRGFLAQHPAPKDAAKAKNPKLSRCAEPGLGDGSDDTDMSSSGEMDPPSDGDRIFRDAERAYRWRIGLPRRNSTREKMGLKPLIPPWLRPNTRGTLGARLRALGLVAPQASAAPSALGRSHDAKKHAGSGGSMFADKDGGHSQSAGPDAFWDSADRGLGSAGAVFGAGSQSSERALRADAAPLEVDRSVTFSSVGGQDDHIRSLREMVFFPLAYPELFERFGIKPPRGVLFHGPPGCGKTLVAKALAASCSTSERPVTFFMRNGADCLSKWVGETEKQLRVLFQEARERSPSIIFFDEIDGLCPVRSSRQDQIHSSIVATILSLMDGMQGRDGVVVIGATNRPDAVDPALRRPGRFDRELEFRLPSLQGRLDILRIHTRAWDPAPAPGLLEREARLTDGYSGADLRALCTEAVLRAIQRTCPSLYTAGDAATASEARPPSLPQATLDSIFVLPGDFERVRKAFVPSSNRVTRSCSANLPPPLVPILGPMTERCASVLSALFPFPPAQVALDAPSQAAPGQFSLTYIGSEPRELLFSCAPAGNAREAAGAAFAPSPQPLQSPRLVISGHPAIVGRVGPALLTQLDAIPVFPATLSFLMADPVIAASAPAASMEERLLLLVETAVKRAPACVYLPPPADSVVAFPPALDLEGGAQDEQYGLASVPPEFAARAFATIPERSKVLILAAGAQWRRVLPSALVFDASLAEHAPPPRDSRRRSGSKAQSASPKPTPERAHRALRKISFFRQATERAITEMLFLNFGFLADMAQDFLVARREAEARAAAPEAAAPPAAPGDRMPADSTNVAPSQAREPADPSAAAPRDTRAAFVAQLSNSFRVDPAGLLYRESWFQDSDRRRTLLKLRFALRDALVGVLQNRRYHVFGQAVSSRRLPDGYLKATRRQLVAKGHKHHARLRASGPAARSHDGAVTPTVVCSRGGAADSEESSSDAVAQFSSSDDSVVLALEDRPTARQKVVRRVVGSIVETEVERVLEKRFRRTPVFSARDSEPSTTDARRSRPSSSKAPSGTFSLSDVSFCEESEAPASASEGCAHAGAGARGGVAGLVSLNTRRPMTLGRIIRRLEALRYCHPCQMEADLREVARQASAGLWGDARGHGLLARQMLDHIHLRNQDIHPRLLLACDALLELETSAKLAEAALEKAREVQGGARAAAEEEEPAPASEGATPEAPEPAKAAPVAPAPAEATAVAQGDRLFDEEMMAGDAATSEAPPEELLKAPSEAPPEEPLEAPLPPRAPDTPDAAGAICDELREPFVRAARRLAKPLLRRAQADPEALFLGLAEFEPLFAMRVALGATTLARQVYAELACADARRAAAAAKAVAGAVAAFCAQEPK